ncbi:MAG: AmmeMemoRadiSam system protein B [Candidatus Alcyoniella australis]|nr:AmmeMemoRadiSam system protein B [Candidatus Alcyoniella australis]
MRPVLIGVALVAVLLLVLCSGSCKSAEEPAEQQPGAEQGRPVGANKDRSDVMESVAAGRFYPGQSRKLTQEVDEYLRQADVEQIEQDVFGLICPHAGYVYSGPVAAYAYKAVRGKVYDRVVIIGPSHYAASSGVSVLDKTEYRTPLGSLKIDTESAREIVRKASWADDAIGLFSQEHSIEVQLPFVQTVIPDPQVVLIAMGSQSLELSTRLAQLLDELFADKRVLYIASSDLSHYHPYDAAQAMDHQTLDFIERMDSAGLYQATRSRDVELCGLGPVLTLMELYRLRGGQDVRVLHYANSGDTSGSKDRVVGYGAVAFVGGVQRSAGTGEGGSQDEYLTKQEKVELLRYARQTVETFVRSGDKPDFEPQSPTLRADGAAFVTLKKHGDLRGCIGQIIAREPLWQSVRDMAVAAASQDPRFPAVRPDELDELHIEISVLTPLIKVENVESIEVGRDGLLIRKGIRQGLLLPQVPTEYGWDRRTFLEQTCRKAGLDFDDWQSGAEIYSFQAIVFSE